MTMLSRFPWVTTLYIVLAVVVFIVIHVLYD